MVSEEYKKGMQEFQKKMKQIKPYLPHGWRKKILEKRDHGIREYIKLHDTLANWKEGRSYRSSLKYPEIIEEMIELSNKYKSLEQ